MRWILCVVAVSLLGSCGNQSGKTAKEQLTVEAICKHVDALFDQAGKPQAAEGYGCKDDMTRAKAELTEAQFQTFGACVLAQKSVDTLRSCKPAAESSTRSKGDAAEACARFWASLEGGSVESLYHKIATEKGVTLPPRAADESGPSGKDQSELDWLAESRSRDHGQDAFVPVCARRLDVVVPLLCGQQNRQSVVSCLASLSRAGKQESLTAFEACWAPCR